MEKIKVFIVSSSQEKMAIIKNIIDKADDIVCTGIASSGIQALEKLGSKSPDIVIMNVEHNDENISGTIQRLYVSLQNCSIIMIYEQADFAALQQAVKSGVRNILKWPIEQKELVDNIRYLFNMESVRLKTKPKEASIKWQSQVVTVFGTKGGIGKTTIAVNLASALVKKGKKVAIIDLDLQFGDVGVFLDIDAKDSIAELIIENNPDMDKIKSYMHLHSSGISVLAAPKSPEYADTITASHIERIISTIRPYYDFIIVDTAPIFNDNTLTALELSNLVLFILTLDISTLRNAKISMGILDSLQHKAKTKIVSNREVENIITIKDAERIIDAPVCCRIPSDWKTATTALNKGVPFVLETPNSKISTAIYNLAAMISKM
jgi:pilus assembly protein CpaE